MFRILTAIVFVCLFAMPGRAAPAAPISLLAPKATTPTSFEEDVAAIAASEHVIGMALAIVRGGKTERVVTHGPRVMGGRDPVDPDTVFRIASLSKGFAGTLVAQLVAEQRLSLDAPASGFNPAFRLKDRSQLTAATLETVLTHQLGLPPYAYDNLLEANVAPKTILTRLGTVDMICGVGECHAYQNVAFNIAADAVEAADRRPYTRAMEARVFAPLGMRHASMTADGLQATGNWAQSHRRRKKTDPWRIEPVKEAYYRLPAAAGVNASITDMTQWLAAQLGHRPEVLSPEVLALLHTPRVDTPGQVHRIAKSLTVEKAEYGLGWRIYDYQGVRVVTHSGSVQGYGATIAFLPTRDVGMVMLTNSRSKAFWDILTVWLETEIGR